MAQCVNAIDTLAQCTDSLALGHRQLGVHVLQVPFEGFAMELLAKFKAVLDAAKIEVMTLSSICHIKL